MVLVLEREGEEEGEGHVQFAVDDSMGNKAKVRRQQTGFVKRSAAQEAEDADGADAFLAAKMLVDEDGDSRDELAMPFEEEEEGSSEDSI